MKIPQPFIPVRAHSHDLSHTVEVLGRTYVFGADGLLSSVKVGEEELLAAPVRIVMQEDGGTAVWDEDYANNESESFVQKRDDEHIVLCGAKQSERFIVDTCTSVHFDGTIDIDLKLMTRGKTVAQVFGLVGVAPTKFKLDHLWLEIPLKAKNCPLFHMVPNSDLILPDGTIKLMTSTTMSGRLPEDGAAMPFKALLWTGDEEKGLGWYAENDRNWQPKDVQNAMEFVRQGDTLILRVRLLDSQPRTWQGDPEKGSDLFKPVSFRFGLQTTPVKPFPKDPYFTNSFHIDCGIKVKGNYMDFFAAENRFDYLVQKGVTTLILHEKWNKSQNFFELSEYTQKQLRYIVDECHKRGIKVLTYFGYELSAMSPIWSDVGKDYVVRKEDQTADGGWWRVPFQRDYVVCYNTPYQRIFLDGVANLMDEFHIDGVYLDGTAHPRCCHSLEHGCGWYDEDGNVHGTYQINAIRALFRELYDIVSSRGGMINVHCFGFINYTALPYIHQTWYGENLQFELMHGSDKDLDLDYFRTEYIGRNMGVPVEFIAYANPPYWKFESALACALLHGILPRPNDIGHPLTLMSRVWEVIGAFPVAQSEWKPYWDNTAIVSHDKVRVSYYRHTTLAGQTQLLAVATNISSKPIESVTIGFEEPVTRTMDAMEKQETGMTFSLEPYGCRILYVY